MGTIVPFVWMVATAVVLWSHVATAAVTIVQPAEEEYSSHVGAELDVTCEHSADVSVEWVKYDEVLSADVAISDDKLERTNNTHYVLKLTDLFYNRAGSLYICRTTDGTDSDQIRIKVLLRPSNPATDAPATESDPGSDSESDPGAEPESDPGAEPESDPGAEPESEPGAETESEPEPVTGSDLNAEVSTVGNIDHQTMAVPEKVTDADVTQAPETKTLSSDPGDTKQATAEPAPGLTSQKEAPDVTETPGVDPDVTTEADADAVDQTTKRSGQIITIPLQPDDCRNCDDATSHPSTEASDEEEEKDPGPTLPLLEVVGTLVAPYIQERSDDDDDEDTVTKATSGKPQYEGFLIDMLDAMMEHLKEFVSGYTLRMIAPTDTESAYDLLMEEVAQGRANLSAAPMTVTTGKEAKVDMTYAFQTTEAAMVLEKSLTNRIKSLEDLVNQDSEDETNTVRYGVSRNGVIQRILENSDQELHKKMVKYLDKYQNRVLRDNNNEGVLRARKGGYAFLMESSYADWAAGNPPCNLAVIRAGFFQRRYAFAVPQHSEWRDRINTAMLAVQNNPTQWESSRKKWLTPQECVSSASVLRSSILLLLLLAYIL